MLQKLWLLICLSLFIPNLAFAQAIKDVEVRGNKKVESRAIVTLMKSKAGDQLDPALVRQDIVDLFKLGFFADIQVLRAPVSGGIKLIVQVVEKPTIVAIKYDGFSEISAEDMQKKIVAKQFTIVDEAVLAADVSMMKKEYEGKGFYLADVRYEIREVKPGEVDVIFIVNEGSKVQVGSIDIIGNKFFSDGELVSRMALQPLSRLTKITSRSNYQDAFVKRDTEFLGFYYRDHGFAKVKVGQTITALDRNKETVRLTYNVEEGDQFSVGALSVSGDILFPEAELKEKMLLKQGELFRYSRFAKDVEMLTDKYGDDGYAFAVVSPQTRFDDEKKTVEIRYEVEKGKKAYFGEITIVGNVKTRDNVVRREINFSESELYSGTKLSKSKEDIQRLGFFEEVQIIKKTREGSDDILDILIRVKEKPTGQLQAALGYSPNTNTSEGRVFGQGRYDEKNQSGRGWQTQVSGQWNSGKNFNFNLQFRDPRVNDTEWSAGLQLFTTSQVSPILTDILETQEKRTGASITIGRKIVEFIQASLTYKFETISHDSEQFLPQRFIEEGLSSSVIFALSRNATNNYLDPTEGSEVVLRQQFTGGAILRGDQEFAESSLTGSYYFPIDFSENYRTYFRFHAALSYIYALGGGEVPFFERYRLGGYNDLRGYPFQEVGPQFNILQSPGGAPLAYNKGGDKKLFFQLEYFFPLIPEAGIKALVFTDIGRVFDDNEGIELSEFKRDIGFGFRWITPIAPFRFEWAYPIENGKLGEQEFIFYLGY